MKPSQHVGITQRGLFLGLVILLGAVIYLPVRHFAFLNFDDDLYVSDNPWVRMGITWRSVEWAFLADLTKFSRNAEYWSPLTLLSRLTDAQLFGMKAGAFHLTNVALHLANSMLLCAALFRLTHRWKRSAAVALLFLVHPLNVEPVCWLSARKDLLSATFFLSTLIAYAGYARQPSVARYRLLLLSFAAAIMAKPMVVSAPFVLLLLDYWPLGRWTKAWGKTAECRALLVEKVPLLLMALGAAALAMLSQHDWGALHSSEAFPLWVRVNNALVSYVTYLRRVFWPSDLAIYYPHPGTSLPIWRGVVAALILGAITAAAVTQMRRAPYLIVGWLWFGIVLGPVIGLVQIGLQAMADRYSYPSAIGIFIIGVWISADVLRGKPWLTGGLAVAAVGVFSAISIRQVSTWQDSVSVFSHAAAVTDRNEVALFNLGDGYIRRRDWTKARDAMSKAVELDPAHGKAWTNLGLLEEILGRQDAAVSAYRRAIQLDGRDAKALMSLGRLMAKRGKDSEAEAWFVKAGEADPASREPWAALGHLYAERGRWTDAVTLWAGYLESQPGDEAAREELRNAQAQVKKSP